MQNRIIENAEETLQKVENIITEIGRASIDDTEIRAELGRVQFTDGELADLREGSIIKIDKSTTAPVDVSVNGNFAAKGTICVCEGNFAIRVTELPDADKKNFLDLTIGQIIVLDQKANEPISVYRGEKRIAKGAMTAVPNEIGKETEYIFGIRITEII